MKKTLLIGLLTLGALSVQASNELVNVKSAFSVHQTADNLEKILKKKGMTIFNRVEHSKSAKGIGISLRDTELIIFGNPKIGSKLMKCSQTVAIDLPQKALIWKDKNEEVFISYNSPKYLNKRHNLEGCEKVLSKVEKALAGITKAATK